MAKTISEIVKEKQFANLHIEESNLQQVLDLLVKNKKEADPNFDADKLDLASLLSDAIQRRRFMPTPDGKYTIKEAFVFFSVYTDRQGASQLAVHRAYRVTNGTSDYQLECTNWGQERNRYKVDGKPVTLPFVVSNYDLLQMSGNGSASEWIDKAAALKGATIQVTNHRQPIDLYHPAQGPAFESVQIRQVDVVRLKGERADRKASTWTELK